MRATHHDTADREMCRARLDDRAVLRLSGTVLRSFLQRILTCDVTTIAPNRPAYGALLTPQGKIVADFFLIDDGAEGLFLDCHHDRAADLLRLLMRYRLKADLTMIAATPPLHIEAYWRKDGGDLPDSAGAETALAIYDDPRPSVRVRRAIMAERVEPEGDRTALRREMMGRGIYDPADAIGEALFPHEAGLDRLDGVDFQKGCFIGQEVVSRIRRRATARKRIVPLLRCCDDHPWPLPGDGLRVGERRVGTFVAAEETVGLALLRLDLLDPAAIIIGNTTELTWSDPLARFDPSP